MLLLLALISLAAAFDPSGCDVPPSQTLIDQLAAAPAGPVHDAGQAWRVLGRASGAQVVACQRPEGVGPDTVERQWLVEATGGGALASTSVGLISDSSFEAAFTGPVTLRRSARLPASLPVWELCGPRVEGTYRADDACLLVVSPAATSGAPPAQGRRVVTFIPTGEFFLEELFVTLDVRSTWTRADDGWRIRETWTPRALNGPSPGGAPWTEEVDVRWDAAERAFTLTHRAHCTNLDHARAALSPSGEEPCVEP